MAKKKKLITTISDPLLEPFYIQKDEMCYTVIERIIPNGDHFRTKNGGKEYAKPQGYYPNFDQALHKVALEKLHNKKDHKSLNSFLDDFRAIELKIKNYTDGIRSTF